MRVRAIVVLAASTVAAGCPHPSAAPILARGPASRPAEPPAPTPRPAPTPPSPSARATTLPGGIEIEVLAPGTGASPSNGNDRVTARIAGWEPDRAWNNVGELVTDLRQLPFGVVDAVKAIGVGGEARVWAPAVDAHGAPADPIVVDVRLDAVQAAPPTPPDVGTPPARAVTSATGVASVVIAAGTGRVHPSRMDEVVVRYSAWSADGTMLETTAWDGRPILDTTRTWTLERFPVVVADALSEMVAGEARRLWVPAAATPYRESGDDDSARVTYDLELVEVHPRGKPPATPRDVAKPPASAKKTAGGVRYRFLAHGKGTVHPTQIDEVKVNYSGWTTDGKLFDTTAARGPGVFPVNGVIAGWAEVILLMTPGDRVRAWIPPQLAYGDSPGGVHGTLVFDIELLEIEP